MSPEIINSGLLGLGISVGSKLTREIVLGLAQKNKLASALKFNNLTVQKEELGRNLLRTINQQKLIDVYLPNLIVLGSIIFGFIELFNGNYSNVIASAAVAVPHMLESFIEGRRLRNQTDHIKFVDS